MSNEDVSFSKYGKAFQEGLAQLIIEDRPFCDQMEEVLDVSFFELKYLQIFVGKVFSYRDKYKIHPTKKIFASIIRTELIDFNEAMQKLVRDYFSRMLISRITDEAYIKETSLDFCKKQKLKTAILKSVNLIKSSSFDEIKNVIDQALKLGTDNNYGHDYIKDFEARYEFKARNPVSTGWKQIDKLTKNGLGKGELGVVIAPTGVGKSMVLVHLGAAALKAGKNVVHYTLELSEPVIGQRYDSCISKVHLKDLLSMKDMIKETISEVDGELIIKEYPTKTASVNTMRSHIEKLKKRNKKIDMIIVDYGDLLRSTTNYKEKRTELESIYESLRALGQEYECPVWTASQTNRSGLNAEVITMESISEAFNKCFVADFIFSVSRTIEDKATNTGRVFIAKNRNGPDGLIYPIFMDTSNVKINVLDSLPAGQGCHKISSKSEADRLKEKYKKYRSTNKGTT